MHVVMHEPRHRIEHLLKMRGRLRGDQIRVAVLRVASALFNDPHLWCAERVSVEHLLHGNVRLVFSVLHAPFNEWDLKRHFGSPPEDSYFGTVELQIEEVETDLGKWPGSVVTHVRDAEELEHALAAGSIAMVHCLEGGVDLGSSTEEIERNVAALKRHGVAYITLAHLFYRQVATNAPAIPFLDDRVYRRVFPQPRGAGLTERGCAAVRGHGAASHPRRPRAHERRLGTQDIRDPRRRVRAPDMPVINSHAGFRFGNQEYMLDAPTIERMRRGAA